MKYDKDISMLVHKNTLNAAEHVKFISYTGKYPCLCSGILTLEIDGKEVSFGYEYPAQFHKLLPPFWESGGSTDWHNNRVTTGKWIIDVDELPNEYKKYAAEIDYVFNKNVAHGCCGGCL